MHLKYANEKQELYISTMPILSPPMRKNRFRFNKNYIRTPQRTRSEQH